MYFHILRVFSAAFDMVVETLSSPTFEQAVGAKGSDVAFLSELLNNTVVQSLIKVLCTILLLNKVIV